jgi:hypothetical protein
MFVWEVDSLLVQLRIGNVAESSGCLSKDFFGVPEDGNNCHLHFDGWFPGFWISPDISRVD